MCIDKETVFILELTISASIPIVIFILGIRLTRKLEDAKNESAKRFFWQNKWREVFFDKYKVYIELFAVLLADLEILKQYVQNGTQNSPIGTVLQNNINDSTNKIFKLSVELKIQAISSFGEDAEITRTIEKTYTLLASLINNRNGNLGEVYEEIKKLNKITAEKFDSSLRNK
jgi:hypothetical protein